MPIPRENPVEWSWIIVLAMFFTGVDAGAFLTGALLVLTGRGKTRLARAAHLISFPLGLTAIFFLTIDLSRFDRFWHMMFQSDRMPLPILKVWSPISFGTWLISIFAVIAFIAFLQVLAESRRWSVPRWSISDPLKVAVAVIGGLLALAVGSYQGLLLQATNYPGWRDTAWLGAQYIALAALTGVAAVFLFWRIAPGPDAPDEGLDAAQLGTFMWSLTVLWIVTTAIFLIATTAGLQFFFHGVWLALFVIGAILLLVPLVMAVRPRAPFVPLVGALVLIGGLLVRAALIMGPQTL